MVTEQYPACVPAKLKSLFFDGQRAPSNLFSLPHSQSHYLSPDDRLAAWFTCVWSLTSGSLSNSFTGVKAVFKLMAWSRFLAKLNLHKLSRTNSSLWYEGIKAAIWRRLWNWPREPAASSATARAEGECCLWYELKARARTLQLSSSVGFFVRVSHITYFQQMHKNSSCWVSVLSEKRLDGGTRKIVVISNFVGLQSAIPLVGWVSYF